MKIGINGGGTTIAKAVESAQQAEADGYASIWFSNIFGLDAMTVCAVAGAATSRIELGTFVVPTFPRHPTAMAQQASSTNDAAVAATAQEQHHGNHGDDTHLRSSAAGRPTYSPPA